MKKVLVTGASGFIGRNTLKLLVEKGYEVYGVSSKKTKSKDDNIHWNCLDLTVLSEIDELFKKVKPTHLLHLAWDVTPSIYKNSPNNLDWVQSGIEIIKSFYKNGGKRAVFAGTCSEYDCSYGYLNETLTPIKPASLYGACKASLKNIAEYYCRQKNISFVWGRIFYVYGPNENPNRVIPYVINQLLKGQIAHVSHGNQVRDYLHVYDVGQTVVNILDSNIQGEINIGSGNPIKLKEIFNKIGGILGKSNLISYGDILTDKEEPRIIVADNNRITRELQWKPYYDIDNGLKQTIKWWESNNNKIIIN